LLVAVTARDDDANGLSLIDDVCILFHSSSLDVASLRQRRCPSGVIRKLLTQRDLEKNGPVEGGGYVAEAHIYLRHCVSKRYGVVLRYCLPCEERLARRSVFED
jgi:hypothetical protein